MGRTCCVVGCSSEGYPGCGISFFRFPEIYALRQKWLSVIPAKKNFTTDSTICSCHFKPDDISISPTRSRLKNDAVPSIFSILPKVPKKGNTMTKVKEHLPQKRKGTSRAARWAYLLKKRKIMAVGQCKKDIEERYKQAQVNSDNTVSSNSNWDSTVNSGQTRMLQVTPQLYQKLYKRQSAGAPGFKFEVVRSSQIADIEPDNVFMYPGIKDVHCLNENTKSKDGVTLFKNYLCSECSEAITGFRYTCVQCSDLDLCGACEAARAHHHHYVLRVPADRHASEVQIVLATIRHHLMKRLDPINDTEMEQNDVMSDKSEIKTVFEIDDGFGSNFEDTNYIDNYSGEETDDVDHDDIESERTSSRNTLKGSQVTAQTGANTTRSFAKTSICNDAGTALNTEMNSGASIATSSEAMAPILAAALTKTASASAGPASNTAANTAVKSGPRTVVINGARTAMRAVTNIRASITVSAPGRTGANTVSSTGANSAASTVRGTVANTETRTGASTAVSVPVRAAANTGASTMTRTEANIGMSTGVSTATSAPARTAANTGSSTLIRTVTNNGANIRADTATIAPRIAPNAGYSTSTRTVANNGPSPGANTAASALAKTVANAGAKSGVCTARMAVANTGTYVSASTGLSSGATQTSETVANTGTGVGASTTAGTVMSPGASTEANTVASLAVAAKKKILIKRSDIINVKDFSSPVKLMCVSPLSNHGISINSVKTLPLPPYAKSPQLQNPDTG